MPPTFDLQSHSIHSDGALPRRRRDRARGRARAPSCVALTDHDTIDGVPEALAAAAHHGIAFTAAAELSAVHGAHEDLHILGYELDDTDEELKATLHDFRGDRARRIGEMADRLRELGFELDDSPLEARRQAGKPIGRPHLADAVLAHPANAQRLRDEGIDGRDALFPPYLVPGAAAYVGRAAGRPSRRRSRSSTRPAASPSGRTRSGTSTGSTRRWPRCTSSPTPGSTASRPSTPRTARRRRACCTRRPPRAAC